MRDGKLQPSYRFGQVAAAIGVKEQTLRNWLFRHDDLDLFTARPKGGWRSFEEKDVFILAVAAELIRFGAPVKVAIDAVRQGLGFVDFDQVQTIPRLLYAAPDSDGWYCDPDENLVRHVAPALTVAKISVLEVLAAARGRLVAAERGDA